MAKRSPPLPPGLLCTYAALSELAKNLAKKVQINSSGIVLPMDIGLSGFGLTSPVLAQDLCSVLDPKANIFFSQYP